MLAVDPSSTRSGGSILGDKTRMGELVKLDAAFIRPSPTGGTLGGVPAARARRCCCARPPASTSCSSRRSASGSPRSPSPAWSTASCSLIAPGGGDELQGIKRGIIELADLVVVNKADGDLAAVAGTTAADYAGALHLVRRRSPAWEPRVVTCSALLGTGVDDVWSAIDELRSALTEPGELDRRRAEQARDWMWSEISGSLLDRLRADEATEKLADELEVEVLAGRIPPTAAADRVLAAFLTARPEAFRKRVGR